jgi:hypothetical protein
LTYPKWSQYLGFELRYQAHKHLSVDAGLRYMSSETGSLEKGYLETDLSFAGPTDARALPLEQSKTYVFRQKQVEIPLHLNLHLNKGRHGLMLGAGPSLNINAQSNNLNNDTDVEETSTSDHTLNRTHVHLEGRVTYQYKIRADINFQLGPEFQYLLTPAYSGEASADQFMYKSGIRAAVSWVLSE